MIRYTLLLLLGSTALAQSPVRLLTFGDSISEGYQASTPDKRYINLIAAAKGWVLSRFGISGQQAADQADLIFAADPGGSDVVTYMIGTNDNITYGLDPARTAIFQSAHIDELAWLALPLSSKIRGIDETVTYSGNWSPTAMGKGGYGIGKAASTQGASLRFRMQGTTLLFGTIVADGNGGEFTISVDGVTYGPYRCYGEGLVATTYFKRTYAPGLIRIPGLGNGAHSVVATVTSASDLKDQVYFEWAAGLSGSAPPESASVFAGDVPRQRDETKLGATVWDYGSIIARNVLTLASEGLKITYVPVAGYIDPAGDLADDGIHPNDAGHAAIAQAFLDKMQPGSGDPAAPAATITGVVNAFTNRYALLIPGEVVIIYGSNLGPSASLTASFDSKSGLLPTSIGGVSVTLGGTPAPLFFVGKNQINAQVPYEVSTRPNADLVITNQGKSSQPYRLGVGTASAGFLPTIFNSDGSINSPSNPVAAGGVIVAYATGQGITTPPSRTGAAAVGVYPIPALPITVMIGKRPAVVLFAGQAPSTAGVMQLNLLISQMQESGDDQPVTFSINGIPSFQAAGGYPTAIAGTVSVK